MMDVVLEIIYMRLTVNDNTYSLNGIYSKCDNSQIENTPIVIVSFGESRTLHFRKMLLTTTDKFANKWCKDSHFFQDMLMSSKNIIIIHPSDEKPHVVSGSNVRIKYQHGNVLVKSPFKMSFALVFRVVQRYELYNTLNNTLVTNVDTVMEQDIGKHRKREELYKKFDYQKYHTMMKKMYSDMKNKIKELYKYT